MTVALPPIDVDRAIEAGGGEATFVETDMTSPHDIERMMAVVVDWLQGSLHVLVNNAGGGGHIPPHFPDATPEQWGRLMDLNLRGPMFATQLALRPMQDAGRGAVINVASTAGLGYQPHPSPEYGAAKAAMSPSERQDVIGSIPLDDFTAAIIELIVNEEMSGQIMVRRPGEPPRLL